MNKLHGFDNYFQPAPIDVEPRDRVSSEFQLWHLGSAFMAAAWKEGDIKEANVRWIFDTLGWYFHSILGPRESHALWVLLLFYHLLWRSHLLQLWRLAIQDYCRRRI